MAAAETGVDCILSPPMAAGGGFALGGVRMKRNWRPTLVIACLALFTGAATQPAAAQAMKDVNRMITRFGKTCVQPSIDMERFGQELWQARGLIVVDILAADGPGESLLGFVFDTDMERFKATFPEFAQSATLTLKKGWTARRTAEMTRFAKGNMEGSQIPRPVLLCHATLK